MLKHRQMANHRTPRPETVSCDPCSSQNSPNCDLRWHTRYPAAKTSVPRRSTFLTGRDNLFVLAKSSHLASGHGYCCQRKMEKFGLVKTFVLISSGTRHRIRQGLAQPRFDWQAKFALSLPLLTGSRNVQILRPKQGHDLRTQSSNPGGEEITCGRGATTGQYESVGGLSELVSSHGVCVLNNVTGRRFLIRPRERVRAACEQSADYNRACLTVPMRQAPQFHDWSPRS